MDQIHSILKTVLVTWLLMLQILVLAANAGETEENAKTLQKHATINSGPDLSLQSGHSHDISALAFSPDGKLIATGAKDGVIKLWELRTSKELRVLSGHATSIVKLAFSADSKKLVSATSSDFTMIVWSVTTGGILQSIPLPARDIGLTTQDFHFLGFNHAGSQVVSLEDDNRLNFWDIRTGKMLDSIAGIHGYGISCRDGRVISCLEERGNKFRSIQIDWNQKPRVISKTLERKLRTDGSMVAFDRVHQLVAASDPSGSIVFQSMNGNATNNIRVSKSPTWFDFTPDGKELLVVTEKELQAWDVVGKKPTRTAELQMKPEQVFSMSMNGKSIAISNDHDVSVISTATLKTTNKLSRRCNPIAFVKFNPTSSQLIYGYAGIRLLNCNSGETHLLSKDKEVISATYSPDGKRLAYGTHDGKVKIVNLLASNTVHTFLQEHEVTCLSFSHDGGLLASGDEKVIRIWDCSARKPLIELSIPDLFAKEEDGRVLSVAMSPDGKSVAAGLECGQVIRFDVHNGQGSCYQFEERGGASNQLPLSVTCLQFSPDGKMLACGTAVEGDGEPNYLWAWDVETTNKLFGILVDDQVEDIAFNSKGTLLITGGHDKQLTVRKASTGLVSHQFDGRAPIISVTISHDDRLVAAGYKDGSVRIFDYTTKRDLLTLALTGTDDWVALGTGGWFDSNNLESIGALVWVLPDEPLTALPLEIFMRQYFQPNLVKSVLNNESLPDPTSLNQLNRIQPEVDIANISLSQGTNDRVNVYVTVTSVRSGNNLSGAHALCLFRDGQLVASLPNTEPQFSKDLMGSAVIKTFSFKDIKLPHNGAKRFEFSAYAYNSDSVKSKTDRKVLTFKQPLPKKKGRAYIVGFGVNQYTADSTIRPLECAVADALAYGDSLTETLKESGKFSEPPIFIPLVSDEVSKLPLREGEYLPATKECLESVLDVLAGRIPKNKASEEFLRRLGVRATEPEDFVFFAFSCHGETYRPEKKNLSVDKKTEQHEFYILPQETKLNRSSKERLKASLDDTAISSADLTNWLVDVTADEMVMVMDCCYSGSSVGQDFKPGPMNSRGLGQLAYYKKMRLLSASQAENTALEFKDLGHGLLTHALLKEGLEQKLADNEPKDGTLTLKEWLQYAVANVPKLDASSSRDGFGVLDQKIAEANLIRGTKAVTTFDDVTGEKLETKELQIPHLFDYSRKSGFVLK